MKRSGRHRSGAHAKRRRARIARRAAFRLAYWRRRSGIGLLVWEDLGPLVPAAADTFKSFLDFLEARRGNPLEAFRIPVEASPLVDVPILLFRPSPPAGVGREECSTHGLTEFTAPDANCQRFCCKCLREAFEGSKAGSFAER